MSLPSVRLFRDERESKEKAKDESKESVQTPSPKRRRHVGDNFARLLDSVTNSGKTESLDIDSLKIHHAGEPSVLTLGPMLDPLVAK